ncbi:MAG: hypothetical protein MZV70_57575 [Desulfobacterales bacterium]|nr:hypothetical protein [Desulfobacterales bacterium]
MDATIRAFFDPADDEGKSAACRFVARYEWIRERLNLDPGELPVAGCRSFMEFHRQDEATVGRPGIPYGPP